MQQKEGVRDDTTDVAEIAEVEVSLSVKMKVRKKLVVGTNRVEQNAVDVDSEVVVEGLLHVTIAVEVVEIVPVEPREHPSLKKRLQYPKMKKERLVKVVREKVAVVGAAVDADVVVAVDVADSVADSTVEEGDVADLVPMATVAQETRKPIQAARRPKRRTNPLHK